MVARVTTVAFTGMEVKLVDVQVQVSSGLPSFNLVGLPDKTVAESKERIRAAFECLGMSLPPQKIIVNLSPADLQKEGSHYDLPIALGILSELKAIDASDLDDFIVMGELALDGSITSVNGALPAAIEASANNMGMICPHDCGPEAAWAQGITILAPKNLLNLINHFKKVQVLSPPKPAISEDVKDSQDKKDLSKLDLQDIKGQEVAKRALEIAAAGGHNMFMYGPPGSGKSMLAARMPSILPDLEPTQALEITMIHSIAGRLSNKGVIKKPPYRDPHHGASTPALIGGGAKARPGEISLAHMGVLFLDELPEFGKSVLESLRQPLELGQVTIARANAHVTYPAKIQLIGAMNPCPCGYYGSDNADKICSRAPKCARDYQNKISGPLMDRIDIHVDVPAVSISDLQLPSSGESSKTVAKRVAKARKTQLNRYQNLTKSGIIYTNSQASTKILDNIIDLSVQCRSLLEKAATKMNLSARGYHRVLRLALTIADLEGAQKVEKSHIAEAISFRKTL